MSRLEAKLKSSANDANGEVPVKVLKAGTTTIPAFTRAVNATELRHNLVLEERGSKINLPHEVAIASRLFDRERWDALENSVGSENCINGLRGVRRLASNATMTFYPRPLDNYFPSQLQQELLAEACMLAGLDGVPVLDHSGSTTTSFGARIKRVEKTVNNRIQVQPVVAFGENSSVQSFRAKLGMVDDLGYEVLLVPYRGIAGFLPYFVALREFSLTHDTAIVMTNVPRRVARNAVSPIHLLPHYGIQIACREMSRPFPRDEDHNFTLEDIPWFDRNLGHKNLMQAGVTSKEYGSEDARKYGWKTPYELVEMGNPVLANSTSAVAEVCVSREELSDLGESAVRGEVDLYLKRKPLLDAQLKRLHGKKP